MLRIRPAVMLDCSNIQGIMEPSKLSSADPTCKFDTKSTGNFKKQKPVKFSFDLFKFYPLGHNIFFPSD